MPSPIAAAGIPAPTDKKIPAEVLAVLRAGRTEENRFYLPPTRLDRALYTSTNDVLKALGGAWKSGKTQAHVFEGPADEALAAALETGAYVRPQDYGFFPTPADLADKTVALAHLKPGMKVLEPSAGSGSLALRAGAVVGLENVTACELLERNVQKLREAGLTDVRHLDFLRLEPAAAYDAVVMNPPFGNMQDISPVMHAARFLRPDGMLVAIIAPSFEFRSTQKAVAFRSFTQDANAVTELIAAGAFKESGTQIRTVLVTMQASEFPWYRDSQVEAHDQVKEESESVAEAPSP